MIESFMVIANEDSGGALYATETVVHLPDHEDPKAERYKSLSIMLQLWDPNLQNN